MFARPTAPAQTGAVPAQLRRDRRLVGVAILLVSALAWSYLILLYLQMEEMPAGMAMMALKPWQPIDFIFMFSMWAVMMVAMMLPSAAPMILLYARVQRQQQTATWTSPVATFTLGYLVIWTLFSLGATLLQWQLEQRALLSPMMVSNSQSLSGVLLIAAGGWQLSPLKQACLRQCRSPLFFIQHYWRPGYRGAFGMGLRHGLFCLGCCWSLMLLLFVAGVMNLLWIALLSLFVLSEKLLYHPLWHGRVSALLLIAAGLILIITQAN